MVDATIHFNKTDSYILVATDSIQISLRASPSTGVWLNISAYSVPLGQEVGFRQVGQATIDNLSNKPTTPQYIIPIRPGLGYAFRLSGEASILLPGTDFTSVEIILLDGNGNLLHNFHSHRLEAEEAKIGGLFFVKMQQLE